MAFHASIVGDDGMGEIEGASGGGLALTDELLQIGIVAEVFNDVGFPIDRPVAEVGGI